MLNANAVLSMAKKYTKDTANAMGAVQGKPGKDGKDGITPHIDETTKNWFIGKTDTGIMAEGMNDYEKALNKPSINSVELIGNKKIGEIGIKPLTNVEIMNIIKKASNNF